MLRAQHFLLALEGLPVYRFGFFTSPQALEHKREVVHTNEGVGILRAQHLLLELKSLLVHCFSLFMPPQAFEHARKAVHVGEGVGMLRASPRYLRLSRWGFLYHSRDPSSFM